MDQININKEKFLSLLREVKRPGAEVEKLIELLEDKGFFTAPASVKYHNSYDGGLCQHCLNVYQELNKLVSDYKLEDTISRESIIISSLLHDLGKLGFYQKIYRNKKINGQWVEVEELSYVEPKDRLLLLGTHEENSVYLADRFIHLTRAEYAAILNHHGGAPGDSSSMNRNLTDIYSSIPLTILLHIADMLATYMLEGCLASEQNH